MLAKGCFHSPCSNLVIYTNQADGSFTRTENGDDNVLLGLAVGMTTTELQVTDPRDDSGDTKLPACPVLMCLSLGGKLSLFSVARWVSFLFWAFDAGDDLSFSNSCSF